MDHLKTPELSFVFNMELQVENPHLPGETPTGYKRIIRVSGGEFEGETIRGRVVPGGDDWITVRKDGSIIQDVRILLETDDNELILMTYRGIRTGSASVLARLDKNEEVDPEEYYFRTVPIFETSSEKYDWINKKVFIATGKRSKGKVNYSIFAVE